jgi:hypothetical protein
MCILGHKWVVCGRLGFANGRLALIVCLISYKKWVQIEAIPSKVHLPYVHLALL